ncbi:cobalt-precorrin-6A reductase [Pseudonocardia hispaniensis]|uniref:Cobalt-precorrin-6A reductase n=1 Tax=Pseudonocardia hispaniensis TaxID=904933 RepID=A0ABW1J019_9PSEU
MIRLLILGGTSEARRLAGALVDAPGLEVVSSLAGRVRTPALPPGAVRIGGFGGPEGLAQWLRDNGIDAVIDATHPFAARMTAGAAAACAATGVPLLVLRRPGWTAGPGDDWHWVDSLSEAAARLPALGSRVFLTTGRQDLAAFARLDLWFLVRSVDPPEPPVPARMRVLLDRGPFRVEEERALIREYRIEVLVTKDSGGAMTAAKLTAAREAGIPVVVQRRPPLPAGVTAVPTAKDALAWIRALRGAGQRE